MFECVCVFFIFIFWPSGGYGVVKIQKECKFFFFPFEVSILSACRPVFESIIALWKTQCHIFALEDSPLTCLEPRLSRDTMLMAV